MKKEPVKIYSSDKYPQELSKKVKLLTSFKEYLEVKNEEKVKELKEKITGLNSVDENDLGSHVFLKSWKKAGECVLFFLSSKSVQATFIDQSQILTSSAKNLIIYRNPDGENIVLPLRVCMNVQKEEIRKKIGYVLDLVKNEYTKRLERNEKGKGKDLSFHISCKISYFHS